MQMRRFCAVLAIVLAGSLAFAQGPKTPVSNTNASTMGTFQNDVDNFMNVNYWQTVKPENVFGYFGFYGTSYDFGAAKQFGDIYIASYFTGDLGSSSSETDVTGTSTVSTKGTGTDGSDYSAGLTIGLGQLGVSYGVAYHDASSHSYSSTSTTTDGTLVSYTDAQIYTLGMTLSAGYNLSAGGIALTPYITLSYANRAKRTTAMAGSGATVSIIDDGSSNFGFLLGSGADFGTKNGLGQYAGIVMSFTTYMFPDYASQTTITTGSTTTTTTVSYANRSHTILGIAPSYILTYAPSDAFALKLRASLPVSYDKDGKDSTSTNGTSNNTKDWTSALEIGSSLLLGMQYQVVPSKLTFNAGAGFSTPSWSVEKTDTSTDTTANTTSTSSFSGADDNGLSLSSGFVFNVAKGVSFDCSWDILSNVMNAYLNTSWDTANTADAFWGNVNRLAFAQMGLNLIVKF